MTATLQVLRGSLPPGRYELDERGALGDHPLLGARFEIVTDRRSTVPPGAARSSAPPPVGGGVTARSRPPARPGDQLVHATLVDGHTFVARVSPEGLAALRRACSTPPPPDRRARAFLRVALLCVASVAAFAALFRVLAG